MLLLLAITFASCKKAHPNIYFAYNNIAYSFVRILKMDLDVKWVKLTKTRTFRN